MPYRRLMKRVQNLENEIQIKVSTWLYFNAVVMSDFKKQHASIDVFYLHLLKGNY